MEEKKSSIESSKKHPLWRLTNGLNEPNNQFSTIDSKENNIGLICGSLNKTIVLDLD